MFSKLHNPAPSPDLWNTPTLLLLQSVSFHALSFFQNQISLRQVHDGRQCDKQHQTVDQWVMV